MSPEQKLDLRQGQSLVMTPQLQQAIKLLQLSNIELAAYIEREIEQNPMLERDEGEKPERGDSAEPASRKNNEEPTDDRADSFDDQREPNAADSLDPESAAFANQTENPLDTDYDNQWSSNSLLDSPAVAEFGGSRGGSSDFSDSERPFDQTLSQEKTLREHLLEQLNIEITDSTAKAVGRYLIGLIDETGYFTADIDEVAATLGCRASLIEGVLDTMRQFDPPGIFARDLADCLALQLRERNRLDPVMACFLNHLDLMARRDWSTLRHLCGVDQEDIDAMAAEIRALNPKPALAFDHPMVQSIVPDVFMRPHPQSGWIVELNQESLPRILVNNSYHLKLSRETHSKQDRDYIAERLTTAHWLVKSLRQRAETILKVSAELVRQQDAFFTHGVEHLKPLILRDIAAVIEMHESTVSRVTANKYIATPRGVFELKYFFTAAIQNSAGGTAHSAESVRYKIKKLIDEENVNDILSDDRLVDLLRKSGVDIARRTIAKYRESMRIPSSVQRRREKKNNL